MKAFETTLKSLVKYVLNSILFNLRIIKVF